MTDTCEQCGGAGTIVVFYERPGSPQGNSQAPCPSCAVSEAEGGGRKGDWIQTFSGLRFWPLDPRSDEVRLEDIAHVLGNVCRFGGHCSRFYSVAQHSVHVSEMCDVDHSLAGLIHDAAETYLLDLPRPIKRQPEFAAYCAIEKRVAAVVAKAFGVDPALLEAEQVKRADAIMLATEAKHLMHLTPNGGPAGVWNELKGVKPRTELQSNPFRPWGPEEAEARFKERYSQLVLHSTVMGEAE